MFRWMCIAVAVALVATGAAAQDERLRDATIDSLRGAAEAGDAEAQFAIGESYDRGLGVERDASQAAVWYQKAADQGHVAATNNLARLYLLGDGVKLSDRKAFQLFAKAAESGDPRAIYNLGNMYIGGIGVKKDVEKGMDLIAKAAAAGDPEAQAALTFPFRAAEEASERFR